MHKLKHSIITLTGLLILTGSVLVNPTSSQSQGRVQQLPINAFLAAQSPTQTTTWIDPASLNWIRFDAFGKRNAALSLNLGTTVAGQVTIRDLGGGIERVVVLINTHNGLCWGFAGFPSAAPAFGRSPGEVAAGAQGSLGDWLTRIQFTQPKGTSLPTYNQLFAAPYIVESMSTAVMCQDGELRSGSGFPDGTPGFAQTTQIGLLTTTGVPGGCPPEKEADCFQAERVQFRPTGQ